MPKQSFIKASLNAINGLIYFFKNERNGQIQLLVASFVLFLSFYLGISCKEWMAVFGCIGVVISFEMINLSLENLSDLVEPNYHSTIKIIKDVAAAAVLWVSIISVAIGLMIFFPKIMHCFH